MTWRRWEVWQQVLYADGDLHEKCLSRHFSRRTAEWSRKWHYPRLDVWAWWNIMYPEWAVEDVRFEVRSV